MDKAEKKIPRILYKYAPITAHSKKIISDGKIYFATLPQLNDPFEYHFYFTEGQYHRLSEEGKIFYEPEKIMEGNLCWLSPEKNTALYITKMRRDQGVFCLSESKESIHMYTHYANQFKGVCIGFDSDVFKCHPSLRPMNYSKEPYKVEGGMASGRDWVEILSAKSNVFEQEKEWRIVDTAGELVKECPLLILSNNPDPDAFPENFTSGFIYNKTASKDKTKLWFFETDNSNQKKYLQPLITDSIEEVDLDAIINNKPSFPEITFLSNSELRLLNEHDLNFCGGKFPNKPMSLDPTCIRSSIREIVFGYRASESDIDFVVQELSEVKPKFYVATPCIGRYGLDIRKFTSFGKDVRYFQKIFG